MKIKTILENLIDVKRKDIDLSKRKNISLDYKEKLNTSDVIGDGKHSVVKADRDSSMVIKKNVKPTSDEYPSDPYWDYVELCIKHQDSNPFFPRIYEFKKYKDGEKNVKYKLKMERLTPLSELDDNVIKGIIRSIVDENHHVVADIWYHHRNNITDILSILVEFILNGTIPPIDQSLQEYVKIFGKFLSKANHTLDIDDNNIMIRHTPHGPQLVITDPLTTI
jgi:hypothetical protein